MTAWSVMKLHRHSISLLALAGAATLMAVGKGSAETGDLMRAGQSLCATASPSPSATFDSLTAHQFEGSSDPALTRVVLTEGINQVPEWAFAVVTVLERVRLASTVSEVGDNAFFACKRLADVRLDHVRHIGEQAFRQTALTQVSLPQARTVGEFAFARCLGLKQVVIGDQLDSLGAFAFSECTALRKCTLSSGSVGECAFMGCTALRGVCLDGVSRIGEAAFLGCTALREVVIPASVRTVGPKAFADCENLRRVVICSRSTRGDGQAFGQNAVITYQTN